MEPCEADAFSDPEASSVTHSPSYPEASSEPDSPLNYAADPDSVSISMSSISDGEAVTTSDATFFSIPRVVLAARVGVWVPAWHVFLVLIIL